MEQLLGRRLTLGCYCDNTQAIAAVRKGYSKRLRYLSRTHRCALGVTHELLEDLDNKITLQYVGTADQKGDLFTKALTVAAFAAAVARIGMQRLEDIGPAKNG
jgi:hypothetical protein